MYRVFIIIDVNDPHTSKRPHEVLVNNANFGIPFSEILANRPCIWPKNLHFHKHFQDTGGAWIVLGDTLIYTTSDKWTIGLDL